MRKPTVDLGHRFLLALFLASCAGPAPMGEAPAPVPAPTGGPATQPAADPRTAPGPAAAPATVQTPAPRPQRRNRVAPPQLAFRLGLMGHASTGMSGFRLAHPAYDGRGVLIAVLDGGVDPGIAGLRLTSTGERKILDVRDFSGEGRIALRRAGAEASGPWVGEVREIAFGDMPQADLNGDGDNRDAFRVEVARDSLGWKARVDTDGDTALEDERWVRDYIVAAETFTFSSRYAPPGGGPITAAVNLAEDDGRPELTLVLDTGGHGSHVAGIAAGNDIYDVPGFDGVAPGASLLALKFADNLRGSVTTNTSVRRAMEYAVRFAAERRLPLVLNMSFGVGNADMGRAVMDSIVDAFLIEHPEVVFVIAAGNEGPGTNTMGLPGSSELALTVGAVYPQSLAAIEFDNPSDVLGWWGSRGGALAKPDVVAPGVQYSTVPEWKTGDEVAGGTSMAAPYVAGLAAVLLSAASQENIPVTAAQVMQAIRVTARRLPAAPFIDQGHGIPRIDAAWEWLRQRHEAPRFRVQALPAPPRTLVRGGGPDVAPAAPRRLTTAAYRRDGLPPGDTIQLFRISLLAAEAGSGARGDRPAVYRLSSDVPWLSPAAPEVAVDPRTGSAVVAVRYDASQLTGPGRHSGAVYGTPASDSLAGPVFVLANTVLVPESLGAGGLRFAGRRLAAGASDRFYVVVPGGADGLAVTVSVRDTSMRGTVELFEPTDRPARGAKAAEIGGTKGRTASLAVPGQQLPPGVWEIVLQALPGSDLAYDLGASLAPARIAAIDSAAGTARVVLAGVPGVDTTVEARLEVLGVARDWRMAVERGEPTRLPLPVPSWARRIRVESEVTPELWDSVTDYSLTLFDTSGARLAVEAMNFPYERLEADLPESRPDGFTATLELFPGFAGEPPASHTVQVRVSFEAEPVELAPPLAVRLPDGATMTVPPVRGMEAAAGWRHLVRVRLGAGRDDPTPVTRVFTVPVAR